MKQFVISMNCVLNKLLRHKNIALRIATIPSSVDHITRSSFFLKLVRTADLLKSHAVKLNCLAMGAQNLS